MKVAILSDIHDNIWNLEKVLDQIKGQVKAVIYCGDFCSPFIPPYLARLNVPIYACLGNNDEDQIAQVQKGGSNFTWIPLAQEFGEVELGGKKIGWCHYPKLGELLGKSGEYNAVFYGHTHEAYQRQEGKTLLANPGSVCGIQGGKPGQASFGIYESEINEIEILVIN